MQPIYRDPQQPLERRVNDLLGRLTLEEKVSLLAGVDMWRTVPIERLGVPSIKVSDGPNGARGDSWSGAQTSACFPVGVALAATWNTDLLHEVGVALGIESHDKDAQVLLGPTVNIHRSPLAGRNFETYSEDPYLAARIAVAFIQGLQSQNVGASIKHYVCNDSEFERMTISSDVPERALREIYLPPFEAAVHEADPWTVMGAYNRVDGVHACENQRTLNEILKGEWGYQGVVVSDWWGAKSTVGSANGGLDLEMPGPARYFGDQLLQAVQAGEVSPEVIEEHARRMLRLVIRSGRMERPEEQPEQSIDRPEVRAVARQAAREGMVLLKNEGQALPLAPDKLRTLAVIGPNADRAIIHGGGSSQVAYHYAVSPLQGIRQRLGDAVAVRYAQGGAAYRQMPQLDPAWLAAPEGATKGGFQVTFYNSLEPGENPVLTQFQPRSQFLWMGDIGAEVNESAFSARLEGTLLPPASGLFTLGISAMGLCRLYLGGELLLDNWTETRPGEGMMGMGTAPVTAEVRLTEGEPVQIVAEYSRQNAPIVAGLRIGLLPPQPADPIAEAVVIARVADAAIVVVGTDSDWETEGQDRADMHLPGAQGDLIRAVAEANPRTIVVVNAGSPIDMRGWIERAPAVLQGWFAGQEWGNALADLLFGDESPSGRLPLTMPMRLEDNPAYINYPGENGHVRYGEGIFVGYRYYDHKDVAPLFPFGHGLAYTQFRYDNLRLEQDSVAPGESLAFSVDATNTGDRAAQEVVQVYVHDVEARLARPPQELKAFRKVALAPGQKETVRFTLEPRALQYYDDAQAAWVADPGDFEVRVGRSSRDIRLRATFTLEAEAEAPAAPAVEAAPAAPARFGIDTPIGQILDSPEAKEALRSVIGEAVDMPQLRMARSLSLRQAAAFAPQQVTPELLARIDAALKAVP
jgi:beta-glucosidase